MPTYRFEATFEAAGMTAGNTPEALLDWLGQMVKYRFEVAAGADADVRFAWAFLLGILRTGKLVKVGD